VMIKGVKVCCLIVMLVIIESTFVATGTTEDMTESVVNTNIEAAAAHTGARGPEKANIVDKIKADSIPDLPFTIRIYRTKLSPTKTEIIPFETYVKRVWNDEWQGLWPDSCLDAGAVAVKMYGWWHIGKPKRSSSEAHLNDLPTDQDYDEDTYPSTNASVERTWEVGITRDGEFFMPEYLAGEAIVSGCNLELRETPEIPEDPDSNVKKVLSEGTKLIVLSNGKKTNNGYYWWFVRTGGASESDWNSDYDTGWVAGGKIDNSENYVFYTTEIQPPINAYIGRLSQWGSRYWAEQGKDYTRILAYFYSDYFTTEPSSLDNYPDIEFPTLNEPSHEFDVGDHVQVVDSGGVGLSVRTEAWKGDNAIWNANEGETGVVIADVSEYHQDVQSSHQPANPTSEVYRNSQTR
jgi:hypothetical protein